MLILNTMCKLLFATFIGYYLNKKDIINTDVNRHLSSFIIQVASPCLIISSVSSIEGGDKRETLSILIIGIVIYCLLPVMSWILSRIIPLPNNKRRTFQCMLMFSNCGFMALPILQSIYGNESVFYNTLLHMPYNLLFFTLGAYLLAKDGEDKYNFRPQQLLSVGVICSILAIIIYFGDIPIPSFMSESFSFIGNVVTPLSMISIGSSVADYPIKEILEDKLLYVISFVRLVIIPVIAYIGMSIFVDNQMIIQMVVITLGMPVGSMVAMGASEYNGNIKTASFGVALSTILSMITIPIMLILLGI